MIRYIDEEYAVAPQLGAHHMEQVAGFGFRTVINNRPDHEEPAQPGNAEIEQAALAAGLHYLFVSRAPQRRWTDPYYGRARRALEAEAPALAEYAARYAA